MLDTLLEYEINDVKDIIEKIKSMNGDTEQADALLLLEQHKKANRIIKDHLEEFNALKEKWDCIEEGSRKVAILDVSSHEDEKIFNFFMTSIRTLSMSIDELKELNRIKKRVENTIKRD